LKRKSKTHNSNTYIKTATADLDYIEMPDINSNDQNTNKPQSGANKKIKPNFFHNYQKKSKFLNSNQENGTSQVVEFLNRHKNLQLSMEESELFSDLEENSSIKMKHSLVNSKFKNKKFSKKVKSQGELNTPSHLMADIESNFEFQKEFPIDSLSQMEQSNMISKNKIDKYFNENSEEEDSVSSSELFHRKVSDDIMFSKKELSNNESLFSYSSQENGKNLNSNKRNKKSKKFKLELDIEKNQQLKRKKKKQMIFEGKKVYH